MRRPANVGCCTLRRAARFELQLSAAIEIRVTMPSHPLLHIYHGPTALACPSSTLPYEHAHCIGLNKIAAINCNSTSSNFWRQELSMRDRVGIRCDTNKASPFAKRTIKIVSKGKASSIAALGRLADTAEQASCVHREALRHVMAQAACHNRCVLRERGAQMVQNEGGARRQVTTKATIQRQHWIQEQPTHNHNSPAAWLDC